MNFWTQRKTITKCHLCGMYCSKKHYNLLVGNGHITGSKDNSTVTQKKQKNKKVTKKHKIKKWSSRVVKSSLHFVAVKTIRSSRKPKNISVPIQKMFDVHIQNIPVIARQICTIYYGLLRYLMHYKIINNKQYHKCVWVRSHWSTHYYFCSGMYSRCVQLAEV